jgi:hypothetical protein
MKSLIAALALLAINAQAQEFVIANRIDVGAQTQADGSTTVLRVSTPGGEVSPMDIDNYGNVRFHMPASTIDFDVRGTTNIAGPLAGYVYVKIGGKFYLVPVFEVPKPDDKRIQESATK